MLDALGELIGSALGELFGDLIFKPIIGLLERSRCFVIFVLLAAAGLCLLSTTSNTGGILGLVPLALGVLALAAIFLVAQRVVANLPDPPAPVVVAPPPELEASVASADDDVDSVPAVAPELPRSKLWFHVLSALAGAAGQLFGFLLFSLFSTGTPLDIGLQLICGSPFGLGAGLLISFILAPPADIQKQDWRENLPRWGLAPLVSFIIGLVIFVPVYILMFIGSAM